MHISLLWSSDKLLRNWLSTFRASGAWEEFARKIWMRAYPGAALIPVATPLSDRLSSPAAQAGNKLKEPRLLVLSLLAKMSADQ
jgi:hypothetical protein